MNTNSNLNKKEISKSLKYIKYFLLTIAIFIPLYVVFTETRIGKDLGGISLNLLFLSLIIGPLSKIFTKNITGKIFSFLLSIRGEIGILMASTAIGHGLSFLTNPFFQGFMSDTSIPFMQKLPTVLGIWAMLLTIPLFITSNIYLKDKMGKWWFRLHKLAYAIFILGALHAATVKSGFNIESTMKASLILIIYILIVLASKKWVVKRDAAL